MLGDIRRRLVLLDGRFDERQVGRGLYQMPRPNPDVVWDGQFELTKGPHLHFVVSGHRAGSVTALHTDGRQQSGATGHEFAELIPEVSPHRCSAFPE